MEIFKQKVTEYFEFYFDFIDKKSIRSVNDLLSSAVRVNELLRKDTRNSIKKDLFGSGDFLLIKMLRNYNEHSGHVIGEFKMTDKFAAKELNLNLSFCCLIPAKMYILAKNGQQVNLADIPKIDAAASMVGDYVDIHPAIFNLSVYIYECLIGLGISLDTKEFLMMKDSYDKETLHGLDHYIASVNYLDTVLSDGMSFEEHVVPFVASDQNTSGLPDYNLMSGLDAPLDVSAINFDDIAMNLKSYLKCIDGKPISYYENDLLRFEELHASNVFSPVKHMLAYSHEKFEESVLDIGAMIESIKTEEIRLKLLNYNASAIFTFGDEYMTRYDHTYDLMLYLSMLININIHGLDHREIKVMFKIINSDSSVSVTKALSRMRINKKSKLKFSGLIFSQMVMLLIEFPFKDHQSG